MNKDRRWFLKSLTGTTAFFLGVSPVMGMIGNKKNIIKDKPLDILSFAKLINYNPYPTQKAILKTFYSGTKYNKNLRITKEDVRLMKSWSLSQL